MVNAVEARGLTRRFGAIAAVDGLELTVREGEVYGLLGPNGAGKTTTLGMLAGVLPPTAGDAHVLGADVRKPQALAPRIGVVFGENAAPEPAWSPVRYLRHFGRVHGLARGEVDARARELFEVLRLEDAAERPIGTLSGGNRRKVELARALLHKPRLLFLDEPTRELDLPAKRAVWAFLRGLADAGGVTIIVSSHDAHEVASLCTRVGVLHGGRLAWEGAPSDLEDDERPLVDALADLLESGLTPSASPPGRPTRP